MKNVIFAPIKKLKGHVATNKKLYLISLAVLFFGISLGLYLVFSEVMDAEIYTTSELDLSEIILGEQSSFSLFFKNLWALVLPFCLIFLLTLTKWTGFLSFFYLGYQGILLGASMATVLADFKVAGLLNSIFLILPINILNFFVLVSWLIVCYKRYKLAKLQRLSFAHSLRLFFSQIMGCIIGAVFTSFVYGFIYPLLLKTIIIVNA